MNRTLPLLALAAAMLSALHPATAQAQAHKHGAHQHGVATLEVAVDGRQLEIRLESPLDNLLGFERAPRTNAEREAVRRLARQFHDPASLFTPSPAASCTPRGAELASDVLDAALLAPAAAAAAGSAGGDGGKGSTTATGASSSSSHAELEATVRFDCANPAALKGIDVGLFKAFPKFRQIDAAVATGSGQRGSQLGPKQPRLTW